MDEFNSTYEIPFAHFVFAPEISTAFSAVNPPNGSARDVPWRNLLAYADAHFVFASRFLRTSQHSSFKTQIMEKTNTTQQNIISVAKTLLRTNIKGFKSTHRIHNWCEENLPQTNIKGFKSIHRIHNWCEENLLQTNIKGFKSVYITHIISVKKSSPNQYKGL